MPNNRDINPAVVNESKEEAKNPGALLGLVMGAYPVILIIGLLVAIAFVSLRRGATTPAPANPPTAADSISLPKHLPNDIKPEKESP